MNENLEMPLDKERNAVVRSAIVREIDAGREIGVQVAAYLDGELVIDTWAGVADPRSGRPVDGTTLFNVYSVTKAITVTALHLQVDRGLLDYDARVADYWPEYAANGKGGTTVRHVITHRAGVPQMPEGATPERICDWNWMVSQIQELTPIAIPGSKALYQAMTFGWLVGELVRRTDPQHRPIGRFIQEEIAAPLGISDLWIGLPDAALPRLAHHVNTIVATPPELEPELARAATPRAVSLRPEIYEENALVRRTGIAAVGGIFNARSCARFFALLAQGGFLHGKRLLSEALVRSLSVMRDNPTEPDAVMYGMPIPLTIGGFWRGGEHPPVASAGSPRAICHPGFGNNIAWADPETKLAVSICHNKMSQPLSNDQDPILPIANAVRASLGLRVDAP
jgi:CubicO group peptidase (beta-lactamase class C family)